MLLKPINPLLDETFVFKPIQETMSTQGLRYNGGNWTPYSFKEDIYDLAFIFENICYYVELPSDSNILWEWGDLPLTQKWLPKYLHRGSKRWHLMTVNNTPLSKQYRRYRFSDEDMHPNAVAGRSAMDKCCKMHNCANGRGIRISDAQYDIDPYTKANPYIKQRLLRIQSTMQPIEIPSQLTCYLCQDNGKGHLIEALRDYADDIEGNIELNEEAISKAQSTILDCQYDNERYDKELDEVAKDLTDLGEPLTSEL